MRTLDYTKLADIVSEKKSNTEIVKIAIGQIIGKFTKRDLMELCPTLSKATIENILKQLTESGEIERHEKGRNTFYTVKN